MKKINLTLFPVPKKYGMMESPQIDIAQLYGNLKYEFGDYVSMNDFRFLFYKNNLNFSSIFDNVDILFKYITGDYVTYNPLINNFYKYFKNYLSNNDIFIFPISVLEQFRIEYIIPPLLFSFLLKQNFPNKKIIFCGNYPSKHAKIIIEKFDFIDAISLSLDIYTIIEYIDNNIVNKKINNLIYRKKGNLIYGDYNSYIDILNFKTPNFEGFDLKFYKNKGKIVLPYELSRGCKNSCFFCYYIHKGGKVYRKSLNTIISDLRVLKTTYETNLFHFHDAEINFDNLFLKNLCNNIIKNNLNIYWTALCISKDLDLNLLYSMYNAGCRQLRFGIESGSQRLLDIIGKKTTNKETSDILKNCKKIGINTYATFIVDLPQETKEDLKLTLNFIKENKNYIDNIQMCSYGELGNFPIEYLSNFKIPKQLDIKSKKKMLFEKFQYILGIDKGDIVEFIRNF